jgi:Ca2+-binding RTX toxin-like protein
MKSPVKQARPAIEPLEGRAVPATFSLNSGVLTVTGTTGNDSLVVTESASLLTARFTVGGWVEEAIYYKAAVAKVVFHGGKGNDNFTSWSSKQCVFHGGDHNDTFDGGYGHDIAYGGRGNDTLRGFFGNDKLYGEGDTDYLDGQQDHDILDGGRDGKKDTLIGGTGIDVFIQHYGWKLFGTWRENENIVGYKPGEGDRVEWKWHWW